MLKKYTLDKILVSPHVGSLVDDDTARRMADNVDTLSAQQHHTLELPHGNAKAWGIEIEDAEDNDRTYRVAFVVEENPNSETTLTLLALEEQPMLDSPPEQRAQLEGWRFLIP